MAVLGGASCGDGGEDRLTAEEFEDQGNEICLAYRQDIADALNDLGPGRPTVQDAQRIVREVVVPAQRVQLNKLQELSPPAELAEEYADFLSDTDEAVATLAEWAEEDPARLLEDDPFPEFDDRAASMGLSACGSS